LLSNINKSGKQVKIVERLTFSDKRLMYVEKACATVAHLAHLITDNIKNFCLVLKQNVETCFATERYGGQAEGES